MVERERKIFLNVLNVTVLTYVNCHEKSFTALHYSVFGGKCTSMLFSAILPFTPKHQCGFSLYFSSYIS